MPAKKHLTPRQQRVIEKKGLMSLTSAKLIAKRFKIPKRKLMTLLGRAGKITSKDVSRTIQRFAHDPERRHLLDSPNLWAYSLVEEMAPTSYATEIRKELVRRSRGRDVPSLDSIQNYIHNLELRTPEQGSKLRSQQAKRREPNKLNTAQRHQLMEWALEYLSRKSIRGITLQHNEEAREYMLEQAIRDTEYIKINPALPEKVRKKIWFNYLWKAAQFYKLNYFRLVNKRSSVQPDTERVERSPARKKRLPAKLKFAAPLSPRQREFWSYYQEGLTMNQIAGKMEISQSRVHQILNKIKLKIKK